MQIQWYPGHMAKGKKLLTEQLRLVDIIIEVLDARIPLSSANPDFQHLVQRKPRIIILNKSDLADPALTKQWITYYNRKGEKAISFDSKTSRGTDQLIEVIVKYTKGKMSKMKLLLPRASRAMIVGIPNTGKSTLINSLAKRRMAKTGNKPGVTKGKQWIRIISDLELLDTPGLLWPKFESPEIGFCLAATGAISDLVFDLPGVASTLLNYLKTEYPHALLEKYKFISLADSAEDLLKQLGQQRGFLQIGGLIDLEKTATAFLRDFRQGKLGRITLEKPVFGSKD